MSIVKLIEAITLEAEVYNTYEDKWEQRDQLSFARKIIAEAIMDKLYWLTKGKKGSENYVEMKKRDVASAQSAYRGDELSTLELRGATANCKAASDKHDMLMQMMSDLQQMYRTTMSEDADEYLPYGSPKTGNVPEQASEIPEDIRQQLEALGMATPANEVIETKAKKKAQITWVEAKGLDPFFM